MRRAGQKWESVVRVEQKMELGLQPGQFPQVYPPPASLPSLLRPPLPPRPKTHTHPALSSLSLPSLGKVAGSKLSVGATPRNWASGHLASNTPFPKTP